MTDLENYCISALRLSTASAEALLSEIDFKIGIARAELIRSGVPSDVANSSNILVENAIIKFVVSELDAIENERVKAFDAFRLIMDELRKSDIEVPTPEPSEDTEDSEEVVESV